MTESQRAAPEPFFMADRGGRLFASLHRAPGEISRSLGLVVCPGLSDEHIACYRVLYQLAERLASAGVSVLRIDPPGHGDSEGELADATPERIARAAALGAQALRERAGSERVGFLGVRLGCVGALAAAESAPEGFCIAWAPILSAERYFRDLLRRQVLSDVMYGGGRRSVDALLDELRGSNGDREGIDVGGYLLTGPLHDSYCAIDFPDRLATTKAPLLLVQRETPSAGTPRPLLDQVAKAASCHHASDVEVFWNFPREGSVPPSPVDWIEMTHDWILAHGDVAAEAP